MTWRGGELKGVSGRRSHCVLESAILSARQSGGQSAPCSSSKPDALILDIPTFGPSGPRPPKSGNLCSRCHVTLFLPTTTRFPTPNRCTPPTTPIPTPCHPNAEPTTRPPSRQPPHQPPRRSENAAHRTRTKPRPNRKPRKRRRRRTYRLRMTVTQGMKTAGPGRLRGS